MKCSVVRRFLVAFGSRKGRASVWIWWEVKMRGGRVKVG